jgi:hypothetical protein
MFGSDRDSLFLNKTVASEQFYLFRGHHPHPFADNQNYYIFIFQTPDFTKIFNNI